MMSNRENFSKRTKRLVAERCAYQCCFPSCCKITIGPGARTSETTLTGKASHIYSASPGGPRGQGGLTVEQLRSPENAIWLCSEHATIVDSNRGASFPPEVLLSYRAFQEARVAREVQGISAPTGWFHELAIQKSPLFVAGEKIRFGKVTLVEGGNGSGKTALCEWIAGVIDSSHLHRWDHPQPHEIGIDIELAYFDPLSQRVRLKVVGRDEVAYHLNASSVPFPPVDIRLIFLPHYWVQSLKQRSIRSNDLKVIGELIGCSASTVRNLIPLVNQRGEGSVCNVNLRFDDEGCKLYAEHPGEQMDLSLLSKSDSQIAMILIEFSVALARFSAEHSPTLLMLDGTMNCLDSDNYLRYMNFLLKPENHFQSFVTSIFCKKDSFTNKSWAGWESVRISEDSGGVRLIQLPFLY